jgi:hypothetical protein
MSMKKLVIPNKNKRYVCSKDKNKIKINKLLKTTISCPCGGKKPGDCSGNQIFIECVECNNSNTCKGPVDLDAFI